MLTSTLRRLFQNVAHGLGFELQPLWRMPHLAFSRHLQALFGLLDVDIVLDVGANTGQYRDFLRHEVGFKGIIVSFEPVGHNVKVLRQRVGADPQWRIMDYALGDSDRSQCINVMKSDDFSSFLMPASVLADHYRSKCAIDHQETVTVRRLDSVMDEVLAGRRHARIYLKMDTQGFDLNVVKGASGVLHEVLALQTEVAVQRLYQSMPDLFEAIQTLNSRGFDISGLFPVVHDARMRVVEFDCVMVNGSLPTGPRRHPVPGAL